MAGQYPKVQLGCGLRTPAGWINVDASWNARLAKHPWIRRLLRATRVVPAARLSVPWSPTVLVHDVRRGIPFPAGSVSAIYASHLLEHLYREEAKALLGECFRALRPDGVLRVVVPDLRAIVAEYLSENDAQRDGSGRVDAPVTRADAMNVRLGFRDPAPPSGGRLYVLYARWKDLHTHKWMYDGEALRAYFTWAGFEQVREMALHESRIPDIQEVEEPGRLCGGEGVCVEGVKPTDVPPRP